MSCVRMWRREITNDNTNSDPINHLPVQLTCDILPDHIIQSYGEDRDQEDIFSRVCLQVYWNMACVDCILDGTMSVLAATILGEAIMIFSDDNWEKGVRLICVGDAIDNYNWVNYNK